MDGTVSWCAKNVSRKQNQYIFIPYIIKINLQNKTLFLQIKVYIHEEDNMNNILKLIKQKINVQIQPNLNSELK